MDGERGRKEEKGRDGYQLQALIASTKSVGEKREGVGGVQKAWPWPITEARRSSTAKETLKSG